MEWADQERIRMAIVTIHGEARYFEGLDMLCELVGWKSFRFEGGFYTSEDMKAWVRSNGGGQGIKSAATPTRVQDDDRSAIEILQGALPHAEPAPKKRGWPKGKPRGPRKPKDNIIPLRCEAK